MWATAGTGFCGGGGGASAVATAAGDLRAILFYAGLAWGTGALLVLPPDAGPDGGFLAKLQLTDGVYRARVGSGHGYVAGTTPLLQVSNQ